MSELYLRVVSGIVMAVVFLFAIFMGGWLFAALIGVMSAIIWSEWTNIMLPDGDDRAKLVGFVCIAIMTIALLFFSGTFLFITIIAAFGIASSLLLSWSGGTRGVSGLLYAGGFLIAMVSLRGGFESTAGLIAILYLCVTVWFTDIGAYFVGRLVGGPKLAPSISPNKTMSGAMGGIIAAAFGAWIIIIVSGVHNQGGLLLLAIVLSAVSQMGDLFESGIKRRAGVKDSGYIIPGHGGMMDRVDGLLFAAIVLWVFSVVINGLVAPATALFV
ncbi:phosphatidate cytidylyltransferase [Ahrensia sp. 13_GOM-1096m]|uniref:phosphatidate cytidylyltransferase n=1 Tax=Ahrensia sp. 13_GOM-1096m TaxID=1380380 RepID=UPI00047E024C|nr:phosphatidate cytidylyltransferase [Ahrensia sp. 13_GOM-1096m]